MIICLIGISGSGKSTRAKELKELHKNSVIINRDKLREMLFGYTEETSVKYHQRKDLFSCEEKVSMMQDWLIKKALAKGNLIILDNTNLKLRYINEIKKKFGSHSISFELIECDLQEAIKRDSERARKVGADVIKQQFQNLQILKKNFDFSDHKKIEWVKIQQNASLPKAFIFDIDGTLAKMDGRSPYDYSRVHEDKINPPVRLVYDYLKLAEDGRLKIIICSGRDGSCRNSTEEWLSRHAIYYDEFHIRMNADPRPDYIIKEEMWRDICKRYNIIAMFDDRNQVVDHARKLGFTVFQVEEGDF